MSIVYRSRPATVSCSRCSEPRLKGQAYCRYHFNQYMRQYRKKHGSQPKKSPNTAANLLKVAANDEELSEGFLALFDHSEKLLEHFTMAHRVPAGRLFSQVAEEHATGIRQALLEIMAGVQKL